MNRTDEVLFEARELAEVVARLSIAAGLSRGGVHLPQFAPVEIRAAEIDEWMEQAAGSLDISVVADDIQHRRLNMFLRSASAVIVLICGPQPRFLAIASARGRRVALLDHGLRIAWRPIAFVRDLIAGQSEAPHTSEIDALLRTALPKRRAFRDLHSVLLRERLAHLNVARAWRFDHGSSVGLLPRLRAGGIRRRVAAYAASYALHYAVALAAWAVVGRWALSGSFDEGWTAAWVLLLVTSLALQVLAAWQQGMIAIHVGALFRQRLLAGAMKLDPDDLRSAGPSQHLGRVLEASVIENFIIGGGFMGIMGILELLFAALVLGSGATGVWHVAALCFWVALLMLVNWGSFHRCVAAIKARIEMTHDLVEKMVGYRTVAAQQLPERLHADEDSAVSSFQRLLRSLDRSHTTVEVLMSHGWTAWGVLMILPFLVLAAPIDATKVAITIGGILLAERALSKVAMAAWQSIEAVIAWRNVRPILSAASRREIPSAPSVSDSALMKRLEIRNVVFGYHTEAVAAGWNLSVEANDRVLVQGPSGGGKSTLCALLAGIRRPRSGTVLFGGLDRSTLGERKWHRRIGLAPQFHENHVFAESFAFNLLMGRRWPPTASDLKEAETICRELGLGDLLERMPGGMFQVVGDTGWQLSHGERSRMFIARVLLQKVDIVVLDESFAALDPENFEAALDCAMRRAPSLIVVAHP